MQQNISGCNLLGSNTSSVVERLSGPVSTKKERHVVQLSHGSVRPATVGFAGKGPFWTCDREALQSLREKRNGKDSLPGGVGASPAATCLESTRTNCSQGSMASRATRFLGGCVDMLATALSASADTSPPDGELTTVLLETKEQRLHWREFLCESVSKSSATNLYSAFDVEAEPPRYVRPPVSSATPLQSTQEAPSADVPSVASGKARCREDTGQPFMIGPETSSGLISEVDPQSLPGTTSPPLSACCASAGALTSRSVTQADKALGHGQVGPPPAG